MKNLGRMIVGVLLAAGAVACAHAGTVIQLQEIAVTTKELGQQVTLYVDAGKLRLEGESPGSRKDIVIFDQAKQVTWILTGLNGGMYMEFTAAQVQNWANQRQQAMQQMQRVQDAMQELQQRMANMPPEQRAQMEQMLKRDPLAGMGGGGAPWQITVKEMAKGEGAGQYTCTRYEVMIGDEKTEELCAADPSQIKLDAAAFDTFKALVAFFEPMTPNLPKGSWPAPTGLSQIQGFPVQTIIYSEGQPSTEWDLVSVENRALDSNLFVLPANFKKIEMPSMPSGMGARPPVQ